MERPYQLSRPKQVAFEKPSSPPISISDQYLSITNSSRLYSSFSSYKNSFRYSAAKLWNAQGVLYPSIRGSESISGV